MFLIALIAALALASSHAKPTYCAAQTVAPDTAKEKRQPRKEDKKGITPGKILKNLSEKELYRQKKGAPPAPPEIAVPHNDADMSSLRKSASEEISSIIVLLGEIPAAEKKNSTFAPIFLSDKKNIFGTKTDFSFRWLGYKVTAGLTQKEFPWRATTLSETVVGSFLYASGTNIGFYGNIPKEETRFYTNYTSEIITLKYRSPFRLAAAFTLDSRQYFFAEREAPENFVMPENHVNIFPRIDLNFEGLSESGIDQLTSGVGAESWAGYGIRNRWQSWGEPPNLESGGPARTFLIYSFTLTGGLLIDNNHNLVVRLRYKGGHDNDFLTRPRFGGTIDNAKLDVVHGFTIDQFRVNSFALANLRYSFSIFRWLRMNLFLDYAHVFSTLMPDTQDIIGSGYGFRLLTIGGLPIWLTHGIGKRVYPADLPVEHTFMIMTAAGW